MLSRQLCPRGRRTLVTAGVAAGLALAGIPATGAFAAAGDPTGFKVSRIGLATSDGATDPLGVAVDPATSRAYVAAAGSNPGVLAVINTARNTVAGIINLGRYFVLDVAVDPQTDTVYAGGYDNQGPHPQGGAVFAIDGKTGKVAATIAMPGTFPAGVTVDPATNTVYAISNPGHGITVIDGTTNKITGSISIAPATFSYVNGMAVDAATDTIYAIGGAIISGTRSDALWAIDGQTQSVTGPVDLGASEATTSPHGVAVDTATDTVYAATGESLQVIDGVTNAVTTAVAVAAKDVGVDQSTGLVYAMNPRATEVIDGASHSVISSFPRAGSSAAADPATSTVYIAAGNATGDVWVVSPSTTTVFSPVLGDILGEPSFTVGASGRYYLKASASPAATFSETGTLPRGLHLNSGGVLAGRPAPGTGGQYQIQVTAANGIDPPDTEPLIITVNQAPVFTSRPEATFRTGVFGSFSAQATGYPPFFSFSETGRLPAGVSFYSTGQLAGIPDTGTGGRYKIHITASSALSTTQAFTLTVDQKPQFSSASSAVFTAGVKGRFTVTTTGFPVARLTESGRLPKGLTFSARPHGRAIIVGAPARSTPGRYVIIITARNGAGESVRQRFVLRVHR